MSPKMQQVVDYSVNRLKEASTWRSICVIVTLIGVKLAPQQIEAIVSVGVSIAAAVGILFPDNIDKK